MHSITMADCLVPDDGSFNRNANQYDQDSATMSMKNDGGVNIEMIEAE